MKYSSKSREILIQRSNKFKRNRGHISVIFNSDEHLSFYYYRSYTLKYE